MDEITTKNIFALRDAVIDIRKELDIIRDRIQWLEKQNTMREPQLQQFNQRLGILMSRIGTGPTE